MKKYKYSRKYIDSLLKSVDGYTINNVIRPMLLATSEKKVCEHEWITSLDGTEQWCAKCKFLSQGHPVGNLQDGLFNSPKIEPIEEIQYDELCNTPDKKEWYHDLIILKYKINQIITTVNKLIDIKSLNKE